nr:MAG TPA: hypothetical protein [Caudoviricetes sp.]
MVGYTYHKRAISVTSVVTTVASGFHRIKTLLRMNSLIHSISMLEG